MLDINFTDESSIWLERHSKVCFQKKGMPAKHKATFKHPYKVHATAVQNNWDSFNIIGTNWCSLLLTVIGHYSQSGSSLSWVRSQANIIS